VDVLILGTGAGVLSTFVHRHFPQTHITAIDIDSEVVEIGKGAFGFTEDFRLTSLITDARAYVEETYATNVKYHAILLDISCADPNEMVPPPDLRSDRFLMQLKDLLVPNGLLMINTIMSNEIALKEFKEILTRYYAIVYRLGCEEERNEIFYLINNNASYIPKTPLQLQTVIRNIEKTTRWDPLMQI
jgi:spermidine synthase